ncbi:hypothetical protein IAU59_001026 [Kwoniella sp. CBS 9459]
MPCPRRAADGLERRSTSTSERESDARAPAFRTITWVARSATAPLLKVRSQPQPTFTGIYGDSSPELSPTATLFDLPIESTGPKDPANQSTVAKALGRTIKAARTKVEEIVERKVEKVKRWSSREDGDEEYCDAWGPDWNRSARPDNFQYASNPDTWIRPPRVIRHGMLLFILEKPTGPLLKSDCDYTLRSYLAHLNDTEVFRSDNGEVVTFRQIASSRSLLAMIAALIWWGDYLIALHLVDTVVRSFFEWYAMIEKHRSWTGWTPPPKAKRSRRKVDWKGLRTAFVDAWGLKWLLGLIALHIVLFAMPMPGIICAGLLLAVHIVGFGSPLPQDLLLELRNARQGPAVFSAAWYEGKERERTRQAEVTAEKDKTYAFFGPSRQLAAILEEEEEEDVKARNGRREARKGWWRKVFRRRDTQRAR